MPPVPSTAVIIAVSCASLALLATAALHDVVARTIPNWISATLVVLSVPVLGVSQDVSGRLLAAAALFAGALACWRFGWLGGGDVKLLGAVGLLVPAGRVIATVMTIALAGAVLALPYLACRGRIARPQPVSPQALRPAALMARAWRAERFRMRRGGPLPYGVAIAIGAAVGLLGGRP